MDKSIETITLGAGCFWCVEAIFESIPGVLAAESGYSGGHIKNPAYREVCTGRTGHAEVVQLTYDPGQVDLALILKVFFATHDPTTLNRQGPMSAPNTEAPFTSTRGPTPSGRKGH